MNEKRAVDLPHVRIVTRHAQIKVLIVALMSAVATLALVSAFTPLRAPFQGTALFVSMLVTGAVILRPRRRYDVSVRADEVGLRVDDELVIPRRTIASGVVMPDEHPRVTLWLEGGGTVEIYVRESDEARSILHAFDLDASKNTATFRLVSPLWSSEGALTAWCFALLVSLVVAAFAVTSDHVAFVFAAALGPLALLVSVAPVTLIVGTDALVMKWLGTRRIVLLLGDIVRVERAAHVVRMVHRDGRHTNLRVGMPGRPSFDSDESVATIAERIEAAIVARATRAGDAEAIALDDLARGDRSARDWVASLRGALARESGFRKAPIVAEQLWPIVESARATASSRAAAAVALSVSLDDTGRARLRIAAQASASPKLRVALELASAEAVSDAEVAQALAALESESPR